MRRIEQHNDISGSFRKEVVMIALQLIKARVPPERAEVIEMLIGFASDLIDSVIMLSTKEVGIDRVRTGTGLRSVFVFWYNISILFDRWYHVIVYIITTYRII
jgi:hypothetical protein